MYARRSLFAAWLAFPVVSVVAIAPAAQGQKTPPPPGEPPAVITTRVTTTRVDATPRFVREVPGAQGKVRETLVLNRDFTAHRVTTRPGKDPVVEFGRWGVRAGGFAVTLSHRDGAPLAKPLRLTLPREGGGTAAPRAAGSAYRAAPPPAVSEAGLALIAKAGDGDRGAVLRALAAGVPLDSVNDRGWTPLISAARNGSAEMVRFLLRRGANPNQAALDGYTPLMAAVEFGDSAIVADLLARQANPNAATPGGGTALMIAAANKFGDEENNLGIARKLVRAGASVGAKTKDGVSALSLATERKAKRIAAYLRSVGAK